MPIDRGQSRLSIKNPAVTPQLVYVRQVAFNVRLNELMYAAACKADDFPLIRRRETDGEVV